MKLIVQIPCYNEEATLANVIKDIPRTLEGITVVEVLVVDDGSTDATASVAEAAGADYVLRLGSNQGLASAFRAGMDFALGRRADIIVNIDGDGQYTGGEIPALIAPLLAGRADIVIGDRNAPAFSGYSPLKKKLHAIGTQVVQRLSRTDVADPVSGFRAFTRDAAVRLHIFSSFSYTTEMIIQAGQKKMRVVSQPISAQPNSRPSRLFSTIPQFVSRTALTIVRTYCTYHPMKIFAVMAGIMGVLGMLPILRFIFFYLTEGGAGHIQSLVLGGTLIIVSFLTFMFALLADLQARNRMMLEHILERMKNGKK